MRDNNKIWYNKGFAKGYKEGQKMMINLVDGSMIIRSDNMAYIAGRLSKDKEIQNAIDEIKEMDTWETDKAIEIITRHTGVKE